MAFEIILPKLGMNMESATILAWHKEEGAAVALGDLLAEIETDKATIELESEAGGILRKQLVAQGQQALVNQPVALIGPADEDISAQLQRLASAHPQSPSHVDRTYQAWSEAKISAADVAPPRPAAAGPRGERFDPEAIRARLAQRGALAPSAPAGTNRTRIVIYGGGLGAKQLLEVTRHLDDIEVLGLIDDDPALKGMQRAGLPVLGGFAALAELATQGKIDGVALSFHSAVRQKIHRRIKAELRISITPLVDRRALIGMDVQIGEGALIEAGSVVGPATTVGEGVIVDVGAVVAHDCFLGRFSHLSPGCTLSGVVHLTENVLVGVGAAINSTVTIGRNVIITPGAAVMNDLPDDVVVSGVPAKVIGQSRRGA